jgi:hypothetical protein
MSPSFLSTTNDRAVRPIDIPNVILRERERERGREGERERKGEGGERDGNILYSYCNLIIIPGAM